MHLFFTDDAFLIEKQPYPDIPFLVDEEMRLVDPANIFLINVAVHRGGSESPQTWRTYGWHLYDYFSFLEANKLCWNENLDLGTPTVVAVYRNWAAKRNSVQTVNQRLGTVIRFYRYSHAHGLISSLPWDAEARVVYSRSGGFLGHTASGNRVETPDVLLRDRPHLVEVLNRTQIRDLLSLLRSNRTQFLMAKLCLATGLRREELLTFPNAYVFNPESQPEQRASVKVNLDPSDMDIKGNRPRSIFMPRTLMHDLWDYSVLVRSQHRSRYVEKESAPSLFLTPGGDMYSPTAFNKLLSRAGEKLGFHIHPHMLRHTFATHELHAMREAKGRTDLALLWVKERLGHSSIKTTEIYLHLLAELEHDYLAAYQYDLDQLTSEHSLGRKSV